MSGFDRPWALCGGWAADAWLGRQTREHGDTDILVFHDDQRALFEHLVDWNMVAHDPPIAGGGSNTDQWDGHHLTLPAHIHARPPGAEIPAGWPVTGAPADGLNLEIIFNGRSGDEVVLNVEPRIAISFADTIHDSLDGVPIATPEVLMFFKATAYWGNDWYDPHLKDEGDFLGLVQLLSAERRVWLSQSIALLQPDHPWLVQLSV